MLYGLVDGVMCNLRKDFPLIMGVYMAELSKAICKAPIGSHIRQMMEERMGPR